MTSPQKFYVQEISKKTNYRANWLPDKPLNVGDVGKIEDGIFTLYTTLEQQGIPLKIRESSSTLDLDYTSQDAVKLVSNIDANVAGITNPLVNGKLSFKIDFQRTEGVFFQITGSQKQIIENLGQIENLILARYKRNDWKIEWVVVTETIKTDSATIIINTGKANTLEFEITGDAGLGTLNLADTRLGLKLLRETGSSTKLIAKQNLTPLYVIKGVSDPIFGRTTFRSAESLRAIQFNELKEFPFNPKEIE